MRATSELPVLLVLLLQCALAPRLCLAAEDADSEQLTVEEAEASHPPPAPAPPPPARKGSKKGGGGGGKRRGPRPPQPTGGVHVTYKDADGNEKDLDDEIRRAAISGDTVELRRLHGIRKEIAEAEGAPLAPQDKYGNTALHETARRGLTEVVEDLLELEGYTVDMRNGMQDTPLHMACAAGQVEAARVLLEGGAALGAETAWSMTPLYWAANGGGPGHLKVAELLLNRGANVNFQTGGKEVQGKYTPLHEAAREGHVAMVELLLARGANPRLRELAGGTALHLAAEAGHVELVKRLLALGLDPDSRRYDGHTPLSLAGQGDKQAVVELLVDAGAAWHGQPWAPPDGEDAADPPAPPARSKKKKKKKQKTKKEEAKKAEL
eukprot:SAG22_NODE_3359_length_1758_cov_10.438819_1_plen_380_part_00